VLLQNGVTLPLDTSLRALKRALHQSSSSQVFQHYPSKITNKLRIFRGLPSFFCTSILKVHPKVKRMPYFAQAFAVKAEMKSSSTPRLYSLFHHFAPIDIWLDIAPKRGKIKKKCIFHFLLRSK